ncbi:MAG TPA: alpha/beta hydrolase [Vicinamibacterales bacterium]|nr:alpha/beta hydrolase [Vicinamibacterales bacterium]
MTARVIAAGALFCCGLWAGGVGLLWAAEPYLVFMTGNSRSYTRPLDPGVFQTHTFANAEGTALRAVTVRHKMPGERYWILFCQPAGGSTDVQMIQEHLKRLASLGYEVFSFDYRGFGSNGGTPTETGLYADALAAYSYLLRVERARPDRVILAGRSLGAAVAIDLATKVPAAGLLLFAPIDSVPAVAARLYPWAPVRLLARHQFDSVSKAQRIELPLVYVYGRPDRFMAPADARVLFERFRGPKQLVETGGGHHHSGFTHLPDLYRATKIFWPSKAN